MSIMNNYLQNRINMLSLGCCCIHTLSVGVRMNITTRAAKEAVKVINAANVGKEIPA